MMTASSSSKDANSVLVWPNSQCNDSNAGYVIGWQDDDDDDDGESDDTNNDAPTIIAAGIIPCDGSSEEQYSMEQVQNALHIFKQKVYPCTIEKCQTCAFIVQKLKIVAIWKGSTTRNMPTRNVDKSEQDSGVPVIFQSKSGPTISSPTQTKPQTQTQLIRFDPCRDDWSYYKHYLNPSYKSMKRSEQEQTEEQSYGRFRRLLMRISETENIMSEVNAILRKKCNHKVPVAEFRKKKPVYGGARTHTSTRTGEGSDVQSALLKIPCAAILYQLFLSRDDTANQNASDCNHYIPREIKAKYQLQRIGQLASFTIDALLGILFGIFLWFHGNAVAQFISSVWSIIHLRLLGDNIRWLEAFPVGFKLNVPLTKVMGRAILWFTGTYSYILKGIFSSLVQVDMFMRAVGIVSILFGFRAIAYLSYKMAIVATGHIRMNYQIFQRIFYSQLSLFSSLWHLFRGKKKNVLRLRSDTLEYDFMQLFLGMILFAICLFLFTTVVVYYTFFTVVHLAFKSCIGLLWGAYFMLKHFPFGDVWMGFISPPSAACTFSIDGSEGEGDANVLTLDRSTLSPIHILVGAMKQELARI